MHVVTVLLLFLFSACEPVDQEAVPEEEQHVVQVTAVHDHETGQHLFHLNTAEVPYGWTTFRFINASPDDHFAFLMKLPEDEGQYDDPVTFAEWKSRVTAPFQAAMNNIVDPEIEGEAAFEPFSALPDWFGDVVQSGGPGFTAPGRTSETTVYLEPGTYVIECYVKDEDEQFHSYLGMIEEFTVTGEPSGAPEPEADLDIILSTENGIEVNGDLAEGRQTIRVHAADQTVYEHMIGHDVHLVRLNGTDVHLVAQWLNWMVPGQLVSPAPATFLGGSQTMAEGRTAYVAIDVEPGEYAWVAEVPAQHEMWKTFTVPRTVAAGQ